MNIFIRIYISFCRVAIFQVIYLEVFRAFAPLYRFRKEYSLSIHC